MSLKGYAGKVLKINLTNQTTSLHPWSDTDRELYLGGKIMAAKIIFDLLDPKVQPLSEENIVVISTGPMTNTGAPASSRFNASTISPLTGLITSSNCGGSFGLLLKKTGYDALIITGKSEKKVWINNLNIMRKYRIQRAVNKIYYMQSINLIKQIIIREGINEIDTPFYEKYWHVLQTLQGALEKGRRGKKTSLKIVPVDDKAMTAKLFINN